MANETRSKTLTIGWVLLLILGILLAAGGLGSLAVAYRRSGDRIAGVELQRLAELSPDLPDALRGRRATAAVLSFTSGVFLVWIALVPFKRGERWAWRAVATSLGLGALLSILRLPMLDTRLGAGAAVFVLVWVVAALLDSYRDFK